VIILPSLGFELFGNPLHGGFDIFSAVERGDAEVTFASGPKARTGRAHHVAGMEQLIEEVPAREPLGGFDPDIRRIHATIGLNACLRELFSNDASIFQIKPDELLHLGLTGFGVNGLSPPLHDVGNPVELG